MTGVWIAIGFLVTIAVVVAVHEGGHFGAARMLGIAVDRFSIGIGPVVWSRTRNGIEYVLSALPIGGYVRFIEDSPELSDDVRRTLIKNAPIWKRAVVIAAGPAMNFILAVVLFAGVGVSGVRDIVPYVAPAPGSMAEAVGIRPNDLIVSVNGEKVDGISELNAELMGLIGEPSVSLGLIRDGRPDERTIDLSKISFEDMAENQGLVLPLVGIQLSGRGVQIAEPVAGGPAASAGLLPGDFITRIDGLPVTFSETLRLIRESGGRAMTFEFERAVMTDGQKELVAMTATVRPERNDEGNWVIRTTLRPTIQFTPVRLGPVEAVRHGWERVALLTRLQWNAVSGMAQGKVSTENLSGPVGIGTMAGNAAQAGLTPMLEFIALISVAIGFMNLIPVPALDGGQLVMLVVEFVRGKPLSEAFQMRLTQLGFVLLMFLAVYVTVNDIGRL